ncbi:hypothetical protein CMI37_11580 [Candidatus Pacearchaeota archaeon]|nr:hypothetical protein [Candidatus Pacearchaeota archaeon]|tara:strand:- start:7145 stop:7471 length:327 start_codon:yes stop_codon:yes gene_type:complete
MPWKKVEIKPDGLTQAWKPELKGQSVEGKLTGVKTGLGSNDSTLYELDEGKTSFWGSTVLDRKMSYVKEGDRVKIEYLGMVENPKNGRTYKDWDVYIDDIEINAQPQF